jgi:hypothetical protein
MLPGMRSSLVALALIASACGNSGDPGSASETAAPTPSPVAPTAAPGAPGGPAATTPTVRPAAPAVSYPDSTDGLSALANDLVAAARDKDDRRLALLLESLRLRQPDEWFEATFGKTLGRELAAEYRPLREEIGHLTPVLERLIADRQTQVAVERFVRPDEKASVGYQSAALAKMAKKSALYSLRFTRADRKKVFHVWSFVHQDGSFRYVGKMKRAVETPPAGDRDALELRLADAERLRPR